MNNFKLILTLLTIVALVLVPSIGSADTFSFDVTSGDWDTPGHWAEPNGPPGAGDTAIIGSGKTCTIGTADQAALNVQVTGTLILKGKDLSLVESGAFDPELDVDGTVKFEVSGGITPTLKYDTELTITGSGTVLADGSAGHAGVIENITENAGVIQVQSGVTMKGSLSIRFDAPVCVVPALVNNGKFVVDDPADLMIVGNALFVPSKPCLAGTGSFEASAGELRIGRGVRVDDNFTGWVKVTGGKIKTLSFVRPRELTNGANVIVSGGTLAVSNMWRSTGSFEFSGGTIRVNEYFLAVFGPNQ